MEGQCICDWEAPKKGERKKRRRKEKLPPKISVGRVELEYYVERSAKVKLGPPGRVPS